MKTKKYYFLMLISVLIFMFTACGKEENEVTYEIIDGQIVQIAPEKSESKKSEDTDITETVTYDESSADNTIDNVIDNSSVQQSAEEIEITDGVAVNADTAKEYNSIADTDETRIYALEQDMQKAYEACAEIYYDADKGTALNVTLSSDTVYNMICAIGNAGYSAIDSNNEYNMQSYESMNQFGLSVSTSNDTQGTYFIVYSDGHMSGFQLYRSQGTWYLLAMSTQMDEFKIYQDSKGRYAVNSVEYTENGWLIFMRDGNTKYTMVRVKPLDSFNRQLCSKYIEPVGYLENNLFTTTWSEANIAPIDFNSLYAYLFGMYNGTQMLSSYNVRDYYKSYGGTRIYIVPTETFESVVQTYFNIDSSVLKSISDFSYELGGYMFLGYNRDYYNVTPKTPTPEVIAYESNNDGSLTLTVNAVSDWYGTDKAFSHKITVMPQGDSFKYISNELIENENNILPDQKLSEMLNVERAKSDY